MITKLSLNKVFWIQTALNRQLCLLLGPYVIDEIHETVISGAQQPESFVYKGQPIKTKLVYWEGRQELHQLASESWWIDFLNQGPA